MRQLFTRPVLGALSAVLMGILPSNDPALRGLPLLGALVAAVGGLLFLGIAL